MINLWPLLIVSVLINCGKASEINPFITGYIDQNMQEFTDSAAVDDIMHDADRIIMENKLVLAGTQHLSDESSEEDALDRLLKDCSMQAGSDLDQNTLYYYRRDDQTNNDSSSESESESNSRASSSESSSFSDAEWQVKDYDLRIRRHRNHVLVYSRPRVYADNEQPTLSRIF